MALDIRQSETRVLQDQLNSSAKVGMDSTLASINSELTAPGRLIAQSTPSLVVTVGSGSVSNSNTSKKRVLSPVNNTFVSFAGGTLTFPSGIGGGTITNSNGSNATITIGANQFCAVLVSVNSSGQIALTVGSAAASLGSVIIPAPSSSALSLGYIVAQSNASSIIQNITNAMLYQIHGGGGASSGSGSGIGDDLDALQFQASFREVFPESPSTSTSSINSSAGYTNAIYSGSLSMLSMSYDASKTIAAGTNSTTVIISSAPSFTVAVGDVCVLSTGQIVKITTVNSQTNFTVETISSVPSIGAQVTVSQCVHTKDIYNLSVGSNAISSAFSSSFSEILVTYQDNNSISNNLYAVNVAPYVGYAASTDNSSWTSANNRPSSEQGQVSSVVCPTSGTSLYLRFFASKTSGSGTASLIAYRAFMQKATQTGTATNVANYAYAFTNGVGSPVNCSLSVVGGKTQITLSWQYALGLNSGGPYGSIDVYLNGQLIPRYIDATLTPDGCYTEITSNVIRLDKDYSSSSVNVEVLQRQQTIDSSTTNTTAIFAQQEIMSQGFQSFVNTTSYLISATTTAGSPAAGTFYSSIINRAAIPDLSQDLKARMGIERISVQQIYQLQNEFGSSGEPVFAALNDTFGQIRFVGNWTNLVDNNGAYADTVINNNYVEITFYGTGLNLLFVHSSATRTLTYSVDGGADSANILSTGYSSVLTGRNYAPNNIVPIVSGLSLGVHTIKITATTAATQDIHVYGFEILNESSSVKIQPGIAYVGGQKLALSAQSSIAYNAAVTGTKGGRVLEYLSSSGARAQAFQAVNASAAYLTSADHTNEEIARIYRWREFGAGRTDDFSKSANGVVTNLVFTLDDGTTTLVTDSSFIFTTNSIENITPNAAGNFLTITFVGTGLDILTNVGSGASTDTFTATVDGTSVGSLGAFTSLKTIKVASGLPYGTHTVKFTRVNVSGNAGAFVSFIVYQPKKPSLPLGAIELADYNVMADFVANSTAGLERISTGTLRKSGLREMIYSGTWILSALDPTLFIFGYAATSSAAINNYFEYTFFGTGFDCRLEAASVVSSTLNVTINGTSLTSANFPTAVFSTYGTGTGYNSGTGVLDMNDASTTRATGFVCSGLSLGRYTLRITTGNAAQLNVNGIDIITPIHSHKSNLYGDLQNTLSVGSNAISDNRKLTPVKEIQSSQKFRGVALGISSSPTASSSTPVPIPDMSLTVRALSANWFDLSFYCSMAISVNTMNVAIRFYVNGVYVGAEQLIGATNAPNYPVSMNLPVYLSAGTHKIDVYWYVFSGAGTVTANSVQRALSVKEI